MKAKRSLGQNFLNDPKIVYRFIETLSPTATDTFVEIGPGKGAITFRLLPKCKELIAIEKDNFLAKKLAQDAAKRSFSNLTVINKDYFDASKELGLINTNVENSSILYISSLPYNVSKKILFSLLYDIKGFTKGAFIIQKEVADDYCSDVPNANFLSRVVSLVANCEFMFSIPKEKFTPTPKVTSAVIRITRKKPLIELVDEQVLFLKFVRNLYQFKRKVIRNSLKKIFSAETADILVENFQLRDKRVEEVDIETLVALYKACGNIENI